MLQLLEPPSVTKLTQKAKIGRRRAWMFYQQGGRCFYCKSEMILAMPPSCRPVSGLLCTIEHVKPKAKGGATEWWNTVAACYSCNNDKKLMTGREWVESRRFSDFFRERRAGEHKSLGLREMPIPLWIELKHEMDTRCAPDLSSWRPPKHNPQNPVR